MPTACALRGWSRKNSVQWGWSCAASTDTTVLSDPTFTVVQKCGCPAVLVEEGFITNAGDVALVATDAACEAAAQAYYECILTYFDLT